MLITLETKRKSVKIANEMKLYSHGALSVTVELASLIHPNEHHYHVTMSKHDLLTLLEKIEAREEEIEKEIDRDKETN